MSRYNPFDEPSANTTQQQQNDNSLAVPELPSRPISPRLPPRPNSTVISHTPQESQQEQEQARESSSSPPPPSLPPPPSYEEAIAQQPQSQLQPPPPSLPQRPISPSSSSHYYPGRANVTYGRAAYRAQQPPPQR